MPITHSINKVIMMLCLVVLHHVGLLCWLLEKLASVWLLLETLLAVVVKWNSCCFIVGCLPLCERIDI